MWVGEDDGAVVVNVRVDLRLKVESDGGDGKGKLAVHDPGGEIDAVAAEVEESTSAILFGVGEPVEKLWTDTDFFGTAVSIVDNELAKWANFSFSEHIGGGSVGVVPGGLVVGEDGDAVLLREMLDGECVFDGGGERLFYHGCDVQRCGLFDGSAMSGDGGVDEDGLGVGASEHGRFGGEEEVCWEVGALLVMVAESGVRFGDADELDLGMRREDVEKALNMTVDEADDGYSDWGGLCGGGVRSNEDGCEERRGEGEF